MGSQPGGGVATAQGANAGRERAGSRVAPSLILVALLLTAVSAVSFLIPGFSYVVAAPRLELVIETAALVIAAAIAGRTWLRFGETREPDCLFQTAAFLTLAVAALLKLVPLALNSDLQRPYEVATAGQEPLYIWTLQRLVAGALLLIGASAAIRGLKTPEGGRAVALALGPALAVGAVGLVILAAPLHLPALIPPAQLREMLQPTATIGLGNVALPMAVAQLSIGALYAAAAIGYARLAEGRAAPHRPREYTALLAVALVVAAFTQIHYAVVPGTYSGVLTTGEVLRLAFFGLVLVGLALGTRRDLIDLSHANWSLARLRELDNERIALEERARVARDIHDGLVQELWLARLTHGRLRELEDMPPAAGPLIDRVDSALEQALGEARQAVVALQARPDAGVGALLCRVVEDYAERLDLDVVCSIESEPATLPDRLMAELLRICREALANVRKHADATLTRVTMACDGHELVLIVADNGSGFDPGQARRGFGLSSMRDRAEQVGGRLEVQSVPMDGTRVTVTVPVGGRKAQPA
ncbi:MAG TPA: sensor histidine kinase [Candidatus Limnocylindrales bacterium]|nr:sensor histidine kinase [Candidatus Limnocylindrales bacterium]